jgi:hypothetical protein
MPLRNGTITVGGFTAGPMSAIAPSRSSDFTASTIASADRPGSDEEEPQRLFVPTRRVGEGLRDRRLCGHGFWCRLLEPLHAGNASGVAG